EAILSAGLATEVVGLISAGKEADVYLARYSGAPLAIKSYRLYRTSHRGGGPVKQDSMGWRAAHEYEMMRQAWKGGVRVPTRARRWNADCRRFRSTSAAIASRLRSPHSPPNSSNRSTGSACCTSGTRSRLRSSDDLGDFREALRGFEREPFVSEDRVPLLVDLVRVGERLH